ncbi:phage major capsid protein, P2 family [Serratia marcescens]|uniref:Phage major capsid protein, P2 family n=1 Tax=Serratia marcescens TaxID=615 RepID=A0A5C7CDX6_SERMA|nr:phage major capsid protein, P2 family [Serratia marcescens]TXE33242.1 phage major capsid protein, P2 family [Serratia marcescens]TXE65234.1 phage major capsid protein, P2 family [Serratia marcescens]
MIPETEVAFGQYLTQQAKLNGITTAVITAGKKFTVAPAVAQRIEKRTQESSSFLMSINIVPVINQQGQKIGLGVSGPTASNTDTTQKDRVPRDLSNMTAQNYFCQQTNFDTLLRYEKIDMWAAFPNFQPILRDSILQRQALDRIMIGWNGTHRAKTSDPAAFPLLQDVAPGWLQKCRDDAPERVMAGGKDPTKVVIGKGGDYENLDAAVMDVTNNLIAPWYQDDPKLVVICGRQLLADKYFPLVNQQQPNSEALAADIIISQKRIGGLQAVRVPYFPANALMITRLDNLSIYWQKGTRRRCILDNAKRDQIENYESVNQDYVIEDYEGCCVIENIVMPHSPEDDKTPDNQGVIDAAAAKAVEAITSAFQRIPAAESARLPVDAPPDNLPPSEAVEIAPPDGTPSDDSGAADSQDDVVPDADAKSDTKKGKSP